MSRTTPILADGTRRTLLSSPFAIAGVSVRNRFVFQSHFTALGTDTGEPSEGHVAYHEERARGGAGLIVFESQAVHPTGKMSRRYVDGWRQDNIPRLRGVTDAVHRHGTKIISQLTHGGHTSLEHPPPLMWAPSQLPEPSSNFSTMAMDAEDIDVVIRSFATCARNARESGFDGVELKVGHDGLLRSFISPYFNRRTDGYGGAFDKRLRLVDEVIAAVSEYTDDTFVLGVRLCLDEFTPWGYGPEYGQQVAAHLEAGGQVDYLNCDAGSFSSYWMEIPPFAVPQGRFDHLCAGLKEAVSLPVIAFGRIKRPEAAEALLAAGHADLIGMARQLIADPRTPMKVLEGREREIRYCIASNDSCIHQVGQQQPIRCDTNPAAGRELTHSEDLLPPPTRVKNVVVVGGGVAGLKVVETAARRGHRVVLHESSARLGGQLVAAAAQPLHGEVFDVADYLIREIERLDVEVRLNSHVDASLHLAGVDDVVVATGSVPALPHRTSPNLSSGQQPDAGLGLQAGRRLTGLDRPIVHSADDILRGEFPPDALAGRVVVLDGNGHWEAAGTAEYLADQGADVTVITSASLVGIELEGTSQELFSERSRVKGITQRVRSRAVDIAADHVVVEELDTGRRAVIETVSCVVPVLGRLSVEGPYRALRRDGFGGTVHRVGDCVAPRLLRAVVSEAYELAAAL